MHLKKTGAVSCPFFLWAVVTPLPVIPHQPPSVLLTPLFLSSCPPPLLFSHWLCMLPYSGLCRGPLERLRRSGGDRQCSRHHTQPGRTTSCMYNSDVPSSCSVTSSPPLIYFFPPRPTFVFLFCFFFVCLFNPLLVRMTFLISTIHVVHRWTRFETKRCHLMFAC